MGAKEKRIAAYKPSEEKMEEVGPVRDGEEINAEVFVSSQRPCSKNPMPGMRN